MRPERPPTFRAYCPLGKRVRRRSGPVRVGKKKPTLAHERKNAHRRGVWEKKKTQSARKRGAPARSCRAIGPRARTCTLSLSLSLRAAMFGSRVYDVVPVGFRPPGVVDPLEPQMIWERQRNHAAHVRRPPPRLPVARRHIRQRRVPRIVRRIVAPLCTAFDECEPETKTARMSVFCRPHCDCSKGLAGVCCAPHCRPQECDRVDAGTSLRFLCIPPRTRIKRDAVF